MCAKLRESKRKSQIVRKEICSYEDCKSSNSQYCFFREICQEILSKG